MYGLSKFLIGDQLYGIVSVIVGIAVAFLLVIGLSWLRELLLRLVGMSGRSAPISYKICILGLPKAGKTTLITAIFELIQKGSDTPTVRLLGLSTINRVNKFISLLNSGRPVGPTFEADTFIFRFTYIKSAILGLLKDQYDVEIADFPGEFTKNIQTDAPKGLASSVRIELHSQDRQADDSENFELVLFGREFYSWIATAQAYVFVIDLADIYSDPAPTVKAQDISARIRASWQVIEDAVSERGIGSLGTRTVDLVFSKVDVLEPIRGQFKVADLEFKISGVENNLLEAADGAKDRLEKVLFEAADVTKHRIQSDGFDKDLSSAITVEVNDEFMRAITRLNNSLFRDLIEFFRNRNRRVNVTYCSMVWRINGRRLGVKQVLRDILP